MKNFKRFLVLLICITAVFSAGCGKKEEKTEEASATSDINVTDSDEVKTPKFINPLTGLEADKDLSNVRPVSIMVNNIKVSLPQEGICQADIMYECLAEGGITRLMMITNDYDNLTQVGSVRSARDYYVDFAESYDCIFVHAGGSDYAYASMSERDIDHIDGVRGPGALQTQTNTFWQDPERRKNYSIEHTLMLRDGAGLSAGIKYLGIREEKAAGYDTPMNFAPFGKTVSLDEKATHVNVVMSSLQKVDYVYSNDDHAYYRFQYGGERHMDSTANKQLSFENVILMFADTGDIPGDEKARIWVQTTGEGEGMYFTEGSFQKIKWAKKDHSSTIKYYFEDGTEAELNRGKTMINVVPSYYADSVVCDNDTSLIENLK